MEFRRYLRLMGNLYFEGAISDFHPDLLRRFGGSLAICASNVQHIRVDPNSMLGIERRVQDRWTAARVGWNRHVFQIRSLLSHNNSPTTTVYDYCARFNTRPHKPDQLVQSLGQVMMANGNQVSRWQLATLQFRQRFQRGSGVMADTFGAIGTMAALALTADDWQRATPEEWDRALNAGEVAQAIGQMAGAHTDAHQLRQDTNIASRSAH